MLSIVGLTRINKSNGERTGMAFALVGLVCSVIGLVLWGLIFLVLIGFSSATG